MGNYWLNITSMTISCILSMQGTLVMWNLAAVAYYTGQVLHP